MIKLFKSWGWPAVVAFAVLVAGAVCAAVFAPDTDLWRLLTAAMTGGAALQAMGPRKAPKESK